MRIETQSPLIGRDDDLETLLPLVTAAATGRGGTVVLIGEGGVGKTRLAEALAEHAARNGFRIAAGRAYAVESGVPYALFADAFMPVVRSLDAATIATLARGAEAELAVVLPGLSGGMPRPQSDDPSELRSRLLWTVAEFVLRLASRQPLLLLLDDMHWADLSSLELLHFLARQTAQSRVLIVCTYNETERGQRPELRSLEQSLLTLGVARLHKVRPLTRDETGQLVRRSFNIDDEVSREFTALLFGWTRGNVFFVRETLHSLVATGRLKQRSDGQWLGWDLAELELPGTIREAIVARLDRLNADARAIADLAAVIGTRFDHDLLHTAASLPDTVLFAAIDELRGHHIILESEVDGVVLYDFQHPMVRQALYSALGVARARRLHATIAQAMETMYGAAATSHADELAYHFARAEMDVLAPKMLRYVHTAGLHALERFANREAVGYLRLALDRWSEESDASRTAIMADLARAHLRLGEYDTAIALWTQCQADDTTDPRTVAAYHRRLGQACYWAGRYMPALEHYTLGAQLLATAAGSTAEATLRLAAGICLQELGRADAALHEIDSARIIAEQEGDTALLARAHRALLLLHIWTGPSDTARVHGVRAAELARASGDAFTEFFSEWGLGLLEGLTGNTREMARHIAVIEAIADEQRSPLMRLWAAELSIELGAAVGDWEHAVAIGEHAIQLARSLNQRTLLTRLLVWTGLIYLGRGDLELGRKHVFESWALSGAGASGDGPVDVHMVVPAHIGVAAYHLYAREFTDAVRVSAQGLAIADRTGYAFWSMHRILPILAEAHCHMWNIEAATAVGQRIRSDATRLGHKSGHAWADACDAVVVWLQGDTAAAIRQIRGAAESLEAIPMLPDAARLRRQLAGRLAEAGDRDGALQELRRVHEMLERMGAASELTRARAMFREIGARPPGRISTSGAEGLTGRELEIARMVADRRSNKAIGKQLDISPRTVSTHLSNIFKKLDVSSRGELVDYIRSHGA